MILRRGADQRRPADVDILDASCEIGAARDRRLERIEIDREQVDRRDRVLGERPLVLVVAAHGEQPAVNPRMQRLDAPIQHLGALRDLGDVGDLDPGLAQGLGRAAGRDDLDALLAKCAREIGKTGLVADRQQRAGNLSLGHAVYAAAGAASLSAFWPPSPVLMRSIFHTIRTSLASPMKPASTTLRGRLRPARVGEEKALFDLGLGRVRS